MNFSVQGFALITLVWTFLCCVPELVLKDPDCKTEAEWNDCRQVNQHECMMNYTVTAFIECNVNVFAAVTSNSTPEIFLTNPWA